ncbi:MAG: hypothetical protein ACTSV7_09010 [Candidatus Baldrarchaeia archaeon]
MSSSKIKRRNNYCSSSYRKKYWEELLRKIIRDLEISREEFMELVDKV